MTDKKYIMMKYPDFDLLNEKKVSNLIYLDQILSKASKNDEVVSDLVLEAYNMSEDSSSKIDLYNAALFVSAKYKKEQIIKNAYPMGQGALNDDPAEVYNLPKWSSLVKDIYEDVISNNADFNDALDKAASKLDNKNKEQENFIRWVKYYSDGENKKYASLDKKSFQFSPSGIDFYNVSNVTSLTDKSKIDEIKEQMNKPKSDSSDGFVDWKGRLYKAIRGIDKILRDGERISVNDESLNHLFNLLHEFNQSSRQIKFEKTAADLAQKYAEKFEKLGSTDASNILVKFAQSVPEQKEFEPENIGEQAPQQQAAPQQVAPGEQTDQQQQEDKLKNVFEGKAAGPDEYKDIEGDATLQKAADKLEEVAASLSDRRIIRHLAEFDIILDKLGIASMFPELAEAQSRLIDSYSYALTRVTKMLGMLSSGKDIVELTSAKTTELKNKTIKEVNKTLESQPLEISNTPQKAPETQEITKDNVMPG